MMEVRLRVQTLEYKTPGNNKTLSIVLNKNRTGSGVPDWRNKLKRGIDASSAYSSLSTALTNVRPGSWSARAVWDTPTKQTEGRSYGFLGVNLGASSPSAFVPPGVLNSVKTKFVKRALDRQRVFNGLDVLGQLKKTIHDIRHPVQALRDGLSSYLSLVKERAYKASKGRRTAGTAGSSARRRSVAHAIQGTWLEYVYGWVPNLQDAAGAVKAAAHLTDPDLPVLTEVSAHQSFAVNHLFDGNGGSGFICSADGTVLGSVDSHVSARCEGQIRISGKLRSSTPGHDRVKLLGFSPRDVIPTVWDLIPYSFLVDYFVNVSDILDALSFNVGDLAWGCQATKITVFSECYTLPPQPLSSIHLLKCDISNDASSYTVETTSYERVVLVPGSLIPSVQFSLPSRKQDFNIAALVADHRSVVNFIAKLL